MREGGHDWRVEVRESGAHHDAAGGKKTLVAVT